MPVAFYPHDEDVHMGSIQERLEILMEAAERYRSSIQELTTKVQEEEPGKLMIPREIKVSYNWQEIARILREIRELPEVNPAMKKTKAERLRRLSEIYEVLRGAKMPKLEAVRIALMNEATQLISGMPKK